MAYKPTKTHFGIGAFILILIILWVGYKYWGWFGGDKSSEAASAIGEKASNYAPAADEGSRLTNKEDLISYIIRRTKKSNPGLGDPSAADLAKLRSYSIQQLQLGLNDLRPVNPNERSKGCAQYCILCGFWGFEPCCGKCNVKG